MSDIRIHPEDTTITIDAETAHTSPNGITIFDAMATEVGEVNVLTEDIPALIEMLKQIVSEGK